MNKIITKILVAIILCSIMVAVSIGFLSVLHASKTLRQETYDKLYYASNNYANEFSAILTRIEGHVDTLESVVASSFDSDQFTVNHSYQSEYMKKMDAMLKTVGNNGADIQGIYIIINPELTGKVFESWFINDGKGHFIYQKPEDISMFFSTNKDMAWYYEPIKKKGGVWIPPYVDATINLKMISYTKAIFNNDQLIGVVGIDLAFDDIEKAIGDMKLYESGYSFLLNSDYSILLHPSLETGTYLPGIKKENLINVVASMKKNKSDVIEYVYENDEKIMGFSKLTNGWILCVSTVTADILIPIADLKNNIKVSVVILLILTSIIGLFISKSITAPIYRLRDMAALISQGQDDIELNLNSNNEIGELSKSIHIMTQKIIISHKELKKSEEFLNAIIENIPDMIFLKDAKRLQFVKLNKAGEQLLGYSREELIGKNDYDFFPKKEADFFTQKDQKVLNSAKLQDIKEESIQTKHKGKRILHTKKIPILNEEGTPEYLLGISEDITERIQVEKERKQLIKELQEALENVKALTGLLPICASCKKIRDDKGYWNNLEAYIEKHSDASFSHGMCVECSNELYGHEDWYIKMKKKKEVD